MIRYGIRHITRFSYDAGISESDMELRMQPAIDGTQQCLQFELQVEPRARVFAYRDALGNAVHHFDLPGRHKSLTITARSLVQVEAPAPLPASLPMDAWPRVDAWAAAGEDWEFLQPSRFAVWSEPLVAFAESLGPIAARAHDPLTTVRQIMAALHDAFEYAPLSTRVDSPLDEALAARRGVCQDFTHIMLAILRRWHLPCRARLHRARRRRRAPRSIARDECRDACLGRSRAPRPRLDRHRSHQQHRHRRASRARGHRPRLRRRAADARHLQGRRRQRALGCRLDRAGQRDPRSRTRERRNLLGRQCPSAAARRLSASRAATATTAAAATRAITCAQRAAA